MGHKNSAAVLQGCVPKVPLAEGPAGVLRMPGKMK